MVAEGICMRFHVVRICQFFWRTQTLFSNQSLILLNYVGIFFIFGLWLGYRLGSILRLGAWLGFGGKPGPSPKALPCQSLKFLEVKVLGFV